MNYSKSRYGNNKCLHHTRKGVYYTHQATTRGEKKRHKKNRPAVAVFQG